MRKLLFCIGLCAATLAAAEVPGWQQAGDTAQQPAPQADTAQQPDLSDTIAQQVLEPLQQGVQAQNIQQVLGVFDKNGFENYSNLYGQLQAFFQVFYKVDFRYRLLQVAAQNGRASATAEVQMDALPSDVTTIPARRSTQMRMQLKLEAKGWKITSFTPADFFNVEYRTK
ncbi:MAG TPA: hypothetical protein VMD98_01830 [Bryocella sp.]|nr:hypothetical protein [Bryocella sp.]